MYDKADSGIWDKKDKSGFGLKKSAINAGI